jgi:hypothetical protein
MMPRAMAIVIVVESILRRRAGVPKIPEWDFSWMARVYLLF